MDSNQASTDLNEASYFPYDFEQDDLLRDFPLDALSNPFATTSFEAWGMGEQLDHPLNTISSNPASHSTSTCVRQIPDRPVALELQPLLKEFSILRAKVQTIENDLKKFFKKVEDVGAWAREVQQGITNIKEEIARAKQNA